MEVQRLLKKPDDSFFLFGPRGVGKSTWLKSALPAKIEINLLRSDVYLKYLSKPSHLREVVAPLKKGEWVWIDEVQKVPALLDEVHDLIESKKLKFALSGSSARKLKRHGANLLAGRAITRYLDAFSFAELPGKYDLNDRLEFGCLPLVMTKPAIKRDILKTYVATYLKEEIQEEGHVRKIEPFVRFLEVAALLNGQQVNGNNIAREAQVSRPSIEGYFSILVDTLLGHYLPAFQAKAKIKEQSHPKFYWFDPGVARAAAGLMDDPVDKEWLGCALETLIFHELRARNHFAGQDRRFFYYRLQSGNEIDFVIETRRGTLSRKPEVILIEVKNSKKWDPRWERPMLELKESEKVSVNQMIGVYRGDETLKRNGIQIFPVEEFLGRLHGGDIF
jgi:predicted AAA+ superfamily ATPase